MSHTTSPHTIVRVQPRQSTNAHNQTREHMEKSGKLGTWRMCRRCTRQSGQRCFRSKAKHRVQVSGGAIVMVGKWLAWIRDTTDGVSCQFCVMLSSVRSATTPASTALSRAVLTSTCMMPSTLTASRRMMTTSAAKNRPMSPHLTIYKFPFNAVTSVGFRATGILLTAGMFSFHCGCPPVFVQVWRHRHENHSCLVVCWWPGAGLAGVALIAKDEPLEYYVKALKTHPFLTFLVKLSVAAPLTYHYIGGLRHLVCDFRGFPAALSFVPIECHVWFVCFPARRGTT
jgi:succinate dehydrogenase/fumarate reductase cytochrome b subunit